MAIYVPDSTRRRRLIGIALGCLVAGLAVGGVVGRATAPTASNAVAEVRDRAEAAVTALQRLPIEYEQALAGEGGEDSSTMTEAVARARATLDGAYAELELFGPAARRGTDTWFATLEEAVASEASQREFEQVIEATVAEIQATFGLSSDVPLD